jgi:PAS domain S-box-containing protein
MADGQSGTTARLHDHFEDRIAIAVGAVRGAGALEAAIGSIPAPIYVTDADGWVTYFNPACIDFAGRTPVAGEDRWCVTWRLYSEEGDPLPHDQCPMAVAIKEQKPVRGAVAIAERPDGTRVLFTPFPTPITDEGGSLIGAVNMLIDITDGRQADELDAQALRCRRLARSITDERAVETLTAMAAEYEARAQLLGLVWGNPRRGQSGRRGQRRGTR